MTMYYGLWSVIVRRAVAELEKRDPSRVETKNGLSGQVTVTLKPHWSQEELIAQLVRYMAKPQVRTANILDIIIGQRMALNPMQMKELILTLLKEIRKQRPGVRMETTKNAVYLTNLKS